jgi:hypothetical protein
LERTDAVSSQGLATGWLLSCALQRYGYSIIRIWFGRMFSRPERVPCLPFAFALETCFKLVTRFVELGIGEEKSRGSTCSRNKDDIRGILNKDYIRGNWKLSPAFLVDRGLDDIGFKPLTIACNELNK